MYHSFPQIFHKYSGKLISHHCTGNILQPVSTAMPLAKQPCNRYYSYSKLCGGFTRTGHPKCRVLNSLILTCLPNCSILLCFMQDRHSNHVAKYNSFRCTDFHLLNRSPPLVQNFHIKWRQLSHKLDFQIIQHQLQFHACISRQMHPRCVNGLRHITHMRLETSKYISKASRKK